MRFLLWLAVHVLSLGAATWLLSGITLTEGPGSGAGTGAGTGAGAGTAGDATLDHLLVLVVVGLIFGVITAIVKPVVKLVSLPLIVLTLGLMLLVINAAMLLLTSAVADGLGLDFHVEGFGTALLGGIVISLCTMVLQSVLGYDEARR